jgi:hypothetical protein
MFVVGDDDFTVARHVDVELEILNAARSGGAKRFERIFRMRTGGTAMPEDARKRWGEEIGFEMLAHFGFRVRRIANLSLNREGAN